MNLEEKIKSMSADEIIMAMVNGLRKGWVEVDMDTFGEIRGGKCFGCAATNAVCQINGRMLPKKYFERADDFGESFVDKFETAIDHLRFGRVDFYNAEAAELGVALIQEPHFRLPILDTNNYLDNLEPYERLAEFQKEH